jgi:hypothetical protein
MAEEPCRNIAMRTRLPLNRSKVKLHGKAARPPSTPVTLSTQRSKDLPLHARTASMTPPATWSKARPAESADENCKRRSSVRSGRYGLFHLGWLEDPNSFCCSCLNSLCSFSLGSPMAPSRYPLEAGKLGEKEPV